MMISNRKIWGGLLTLSAIILYIVLALVPSSAAKVVSEETSMPNMAASASKNGPDTAVQKLQTATGDSAIIRTDRATGVVDFVRFENGATLSLGRSESPEAQAAAFFNEYGDLFGLKDAAAELRLLEVSSDNLGMTRLAYQQVHQDVDVFAGILHIHLNGKNEITAVNGTFVPDIILKAEPSLSSDAAANIAVDEVLLQNAFKSAKADFTAVGAQLTVFRAGLAKGISGQSYLVYEVEVVNSDSTVREFVYVDAHSGRVIDQISGIYDAMDRQVYLDTFDPVNLVWSEGDPLPYSGRTATETLEINNIITYTAQIYDFFFDTFSYDSWDDLGSPLYTRWGDIGGCPNAFAGGGFGSFCEGVASDETVGHEWGHNYTDSTHNLIYQWQSGALNESYSDIWGEVIDLINGLDDYSTPNDTVPGSRTPDACSRYGNGAITDDDNFRWVLGEDDYGFGPAPYDSAIRDMWTPTCFGDPGKVTDTAQYVCSTVDGGGVHTNSGIPNHAFALLVDGGTYNGQTVSAIGMVKAAHIYWRAQEIYQTPSTDFTDHADSLEASCSDLETAGTNLTGFDGLPSGEIISAADCTEVSDAIAAVELRTEPTFCGFTPLLDPNAPALCAGVGNVESVLSEDWESGLGSWQVGTRDVVSATTFDTADWAVVGSLPDGRAGMAAFVEDNPAYGNCSEDTEAGVLYMESPTMTLPISATVPRIALNHWVATELGWDGGNVKISVNGGAWELIPAANFTFNGYNGAVGGDNPLAGEDTWTGTDGGTVTGSWGQSQLHLFGIAGPGDEIQLRIEMGLDGCNGVIGWYVDEVEVYSCSAEVPGQSCGDSILDVAETCDDGNQLDGDGCSNTCQVETDFVCTAPIPGSSSGNAVADGSFEGGSPNSDWAQFSSHGFDVIGAWGVASDGTNSVWFGGWDTYENGIITQTLIIPSTASTLDFDLLVGICDDPVDYMNVLIDGNEVFNTGACVVSSNFTTQNVDISTYADDGNHTLVFNSETFATNSTHSNFFLDNVVIDDGTTVPPTPSSCRKDGFVLGCGEPEVGFEFGIPAGWVITSTNTSLADWGTTDDGFCGSDASPDFNTASTLGEAACVDSDAAGGFVDSYLCSPAFDLTQTNLLTVSLDFLYNYQIFGAPGADDLFEVLVSTVGPEGPYDPALLSVNDDDPVGGIGVAPGTAASLDLSGYLGEPTVYVCYHYSGDYDWYAHVDQAQLTCTQGTYLPVIHKN